MNIQPIGISRGYSSRKSDYSQPAFGNKNLKKIKQEIWEATSDAAGSIKETIYSQTGKSTESIKDAIYSAENRSTMSIKSEVKWVLYPIAALMAIYTLNILWDNSTTQKQIKKVQSTIDSTNKANNAAYKGLVNHIDSSNNSVIKKIDSTNKENNAREFVKAVVPDSVYNKIVRKINKGNGKYTWENFEKRLKSTGKKVR